MKYIQLSSYLFAGFVLPLTMLAHGEVPDGHEEPVDVANPDSRGGVIVALIVFAVLFAGFIWYAKRQNTPPTTPTSPLV